MATKEELLQELDVENRYSHLNTGRLLTEEEPSDEKLKQAKDELKAWSPGTKHEQDIIDMMDELYPDSDSDSGVEPNPDEPNPDEPNPDEPNPDEPNPDEPTETTYTITWKDGDDVLNTTTVKEGETPSYGEENPSKEGYNFLGWEPEIAPATEDAIYTAKWESTTTEPETDPEV